MGDHSHHHQHDHHHHNHEHSHARSLSTDLYKDIRKAYKSIVHRWHPDHKSSTVGKKERDDKFNDLEEGYRTIYSMEQEEKSRRSDKPSKDKHNRQSMDDSAFQSHSSSFLSKNSSRRCTTPSPRPTYLSSPSKKLNFSLSRTFSRRNRAKAETSPSLSKSVSRNSPSPLSRSVSRNAPSPLSRSVSGNCTSSSENEMGNMSRSTSKRSTTPIIFSQSTARRKPAPVEKVLECTLEELCHGGLKNIKVIRDVISDEGIIVQEEETLTINLKPGWKKGTKVTFEGKGDEKPGYLPADINFVIQEKRHPLFKRQGDDLEIAVEIPLVKALTGCSLSVPLLGGETMSIHIDDIIYPGYEKVIQGQGMPNAKGGMRGDLRITFFIKFPTQLTDQQRSKACSILLEDCSL